MAALDTYLEKIKDLTIMPPVLLSVLALNDDNEMHFGKLEKMVQSDQILVTRLLRLANSPFYSRGNRVQNVRQIITRLGFRTVRSMVAMAFADSIFATGNYRKFRMEVWEHSIAAGIISQFLCNDLQRKKELDGAMIGGLLQDLGKIVLNTIDRKQYIQVLSEYLESEQDIREIEKKYFEVDNVEMGEAAARQWKLPAEIIDVISKRHEEIVKQSITVQLVSFSDVIARKAGYGKYEAKLDERCKNYMELFGIAENKREELPKKYAQMMVNDELYKFCITMT